MSKFKVGDILVKKKKENLCDYRKVLGVINHNLYVLSYEANTLDDEENIKSPYRHFYTLEDINNKYNLLGKNDIPEYTMEEAIEKMGHNFKIIK